MRKKKIFTAAAAVGAITAGMHIFNRLNQMRATAKGYFSKKNDYVYEWRFGNIHYTVHGEGAPLLLVHHADFDGSSYEWHPLIDTLAKKHTVYAIDLLGCGVSDKPKLIFTNYLYVQLLNDFVKNVIKRKTDVMTCGNASSIAVMACAMAPEQYYRLLFLNPQSVSASGKTIRVNHKVLKYLVELPIAGTFIYNIVSSSFMLIAKAKNHYFGNVESVYGENIHDFVDKLRESAHLCGSSAKYMYTSVRCHYTDIFIGTALAKLDHSIFVVTSDEKESQRAGEEYKFYNPAVETAVIHGVKMLMSMEKPQEVLDLCDIYLEN